MLVIFNIILMALTAFYGIYLFYLRRKESERVKLLRQQERFMGNLVSEYGANENLMEALENSMRREDTLYNHENNKMLDALSDGADSESGEYFVRHAKNSFLSLLFALCATIRSYGDSVYDGVSLFARNLRYIKDELRAALLLSEEKKYQFSGLDMLSLLPIFFTIPIEDWARGIDDEMTGYYSGIYGIVTLLICFFVTIGSMWIISLMEYDSASNARASFFGNLFLKSGLFSYLLDRHITRNYSKYLRLNEELKKMSVYEDIKLFIAERIGSGLIFMISVGIAMPVFLTMGDSGTDSFPVFLAVLPAAFLTGFLMPKIRVMIYHYRNKNRMMEETLLFQTLILLLMHYSEITVEEILSWMERFSDVFRESIERAVDDFSYRRKESLDRLMEELSYEPAVRLAECMAACDEIEVTRAFYDLESEREYYMEQYRQSAFDSLKERGAFCRLIAFAPFVSVLALRLIIPFVLVGLTELSGYSNMFG